MVQICQKFVNFVKFSSHDFFFKKKMMLLLYKEGLTL